MCWFLYRWNFWWWRLCPLASLKATSMRWTRRCRWLGCSRECWTCSRWDSHCFTEYFFCCCFYWLTLLVFQIHALHISWLTPSTYLTLPNSDQRYEGAFGLLVRRREEHGHARGTTSPWHSHLRPAEIMPISLYDQSRQFFVVFFWTASFRLLSLFKTNCCVIQKKLA